MKNCFLCSESWGRGLTAMWKSQLQGRGAGRWRKWGTVQGPQAEVSGKAENSPTLLSPGVAQPAPSLSLQSLPASRTPAGRVALALTRPF